MIDFEAVFFVPLVFTSPAASEYWFSLDHLRYRIAGPLDAIATGKGCGYAYENNDAYFTGVRDPESLRWRLLEWHSEYVHSIESFRPGSSTETADLALMLGWTDHLRQLIDEFSRIEEARFHLSKNSRPCS